MKRLALALLLIAASAAAEDSPLVKAAKASGGKRKPTGKVITNEDVKKAGAKSTLPPGKPTAAPATTTPRTAQQKLAEQRIAAAAASKRVADAEARVSKLEKELSRVEQTYYESNDPTTRDKEIVERFSQTKHQLDAARKELADARDAQQRATKTQ